MGAFFCWDSDVYSLLIWQIYSISFRLLVLIIRIVRFSKSVLRNKRKVFGWSFSILLLYQIFIIFVDRLDIKRILCDGQLVFFRPLLCFESCGFGLSEILIFSILFHCFLKFFKLRLIVQISQIYGLSNILS